MTKTEMLNYLARKTDDWLDFFDIQGKGNVFHQCITGLDFEITKSDFESHIGIKTTHYTDSIGKEFRRREYANGKVWWQVRQSKHDDWMVVSGDPSTYIELEEV